MAGMGFPGLFVSQLPPNCGQVDHFVFVSTVWGSMVNLVRIDLRTKDKVSLMDIHVNNDNEDSMDDSTTRLLKSHSLLCGTPKGGWIVLEVALNIPPENNDDDGDSSSFTQDGDVVVVQAKVVAELLPIACTSFSSVRKLQPTSASSSHHLELISIPPPRVEGAVKTSTPLQSQLLWPQTFDKTKNIPFGSRSSRGTPFCVHTRSRVFVPQLSWFDWSWTSFVGKSLDTCWISGCPSFQLSVVDCRLSIVNCRLLVVIVVLSMLLLLLLLLLLTGYLVVEVALRDPIGCDTTYVTLFLFPPPPQVYYFS